MTVSTSNDIVAIRADVASGMAWQQLGGMPHVSVKELWSSDGAAAGFLRIDPHAREVAHLHSHGGHHLWVLDGHVEINGIGLPAGSYVHVPAGALHALTNPGEQACTLGFVFLSQPAAQPPPSPAADERPSRHLPNLAPRRGGRPVGVRVPARGRR